MMTTTRLLGCVMLAATMGCHASGGTKDGEPGSAGASERSAPALSEACCRLRSLCDHCGCSAAVADVAAADKTSACAEIVEQSEGCVSMRDDDPFGIADAIAYCSEVSVVDDYLDPLDVIPVRPEYVPERNFEWLQSVCDCSAGCLDTLDGPVCSQPCAEGRQACPDDDACVPVAWDGTGRCLPRGSVELGERCLYHTDCGSEVCAYVHDRLTGVWRGHCRAPCPRGDDCPTGEYCEHVEVRHIRGACVPAAAAGEQCYRDVHCLSGECERNTCL